MKVLGCRTLADNRWYALLLRWNPSAALEANRCVSSGVYVLSRKRWTNAGGYAPAKPQSPCRGLEEDYRLWGPWEKTVRAKKQRTSTLDRH